MIAWLEQIDWQYPWAWLLALQPLAMNLLLRIRRKRVLAYAEPHLHPWAVTAPGGPGHGPGLGWLNILLWIMLAVALAGPRIPEKPGPTASSQNALRRDVEVMVVLNVSPSMGGADVDPSRLERAKLELNDLTRRLKGERIGLVVFSGYGGLVLPPTFDYGLFQYGLGLADTTLIHQLHTNIPSAVNLAWETLGKEKARSKAILLMTGADPLAVSGEDGALALAAVKRINEQGGILSVAGVVPANDPEASKLKDMAEIGGGKYAPIGDGDRDWETLYDQGIATLPSDYGRVGDSGQWHLLIGWALVPAFILLVMQVFRIRRLSPPLILLGLLALFPLQGWSAQALEQEAYQAYQAHDFARAQVLYGQVSGMKGRMGEGSSAYRRRDYHYAIHQFTLALLEAKSPDQYADALYNLGNAHFQSARFDGAYEAYRDALRYRSNDRRILANLELARLRLVALRQARSGEGILGRRGAQVGGKLDENIDDQPVGMEEDKQKGPLMTLDESEAAKKAARGETADAVAANVRGQGGRSSRGSEQAYQAAAKKLELVQDQPKSLLSPLIKFEDEHRPAGASQP